MDSQKVPKPVKLHHQLWVPNLHDPALSPVLLLHGIGGLLSTWNRVSSKIANQTRRKVYAVDMRNHGQSEWSENNAIYHHEADIKNFLLENEIKKCILIGHSFGGKIAMVIALKQPELVEKIITEEIQLSNPSEKHLASLLELLTAAKKISNLPKGIDELDIRNLLSRLVAEKFPAHNDFAYCMPLRKKCDGSFEFDFNLEVIDRTFRDRTAFDIDFNECKKFTGPTLVMYGKNSEMKVEEDEKILEFFPNAEFCKVEIYTHVLHGDRPDEFIRKVSTFINK